MQNFKVYLFLTLTASMLFFCSAHAFSYDIPVPPVKSVQACSVTQTDNYLVLSFILDNGSVSVSIEDVNGDTVYETDTTAASGSSLIIDTTGWDSGIYTLTVTNSVGVIYTTDVVII